MSFTSVRDGLHAVVDTVAAIKVVLDYEPAQVQISPFAYILFDSAVRSQAGQITAMRYRFMVRVATPVTDSKAAEDELVQTALLVMNAVDANPQFSGALVSGLAQAPDAQAGWVQFGGLNSVKCRVIDVYVSAVEKTAYAGAIS